MYDTDQNCLGETIKEQVLHDVLFFIDGSLGLMISILQGKLDPADFQENHNAINDNMPEVLRGYIE